MAQKTAKSDGEVVSLSPEEIRARQKMLLDQDKSDEVAAALVESIRQAKLKEQEREERRIRRNRQYYVECRRCHGIALFLTHDPRGGIITPDMWFALGLKKVTEPWYHPFLPCANCAALNIETHVACQMVHGGFRFPGRYQRFIKWKDLSKRPKDGELGTSEPLTEEEERQAEQELQRARKELGLTK